MVGSKSNDLRKRYILSLEWKRVGVTESDTGVDDTDELRELGWEEWEKEWSGLGWRNKAGPYHTNDTITIPGTASAKYALQQSSYSKNIQFKQHYKMYINIISISCSFSIEIWMWNGSEWVSESSHSTHNRSSQWRVFPGNRSCYWQPKNNQIIYST